MNIIIDSPLEEVGYYSQHLRRVTSLLHSFATVRPKGEFFLTVLISLQRTPAYLNCRFLLDKEKTSSEMNRDVMFGIFGRCLVNKAVVLKQREVKC